MKKVLLREMAIYAVLLLTMALLMHPDLLTDPSQRMAVLQDRGNYLHPLVYAGVLYALIGIIRIAVRFLRRIGSRQKKN
jgi:hypothetical protein